ncbi:hypothetical protein [Christiangramia echinicola]|uniref:Uncharacterized protein n=1 Tax=Christiangramia echinicola TaxID=279359 RepID=A0A1H1KWZ1_9FLAO|nr:hypothetical protein [Christiangramia echinicola]SDR66570.1 hypothetical protein SAMN04488552_0300 [Christiangramia echinicola]
MRKKLFRGIIIIILAIPLFMWLAWLVTPNTKLVIAIIDKTVLTKKGQEHISLNWVLNNKKYTKTSEDPYEVSHDYFGFFPKDDEEFKLKGLERFSYPKLNQLSEDADLVYFTDTYGIYNNEWFHDGDINERSGILYGGLSDKDLQLLRLMKEKKKLIITEFNTIGSPTARENRVKFEKLFQLRWTGWTARYFENLDIRSNDEIPAWLVRNYKNAHQGNWPFKRSGIAFVNDKDEVVIIEEGVHLNRAMPQIETKQEFQEEYGLPESIKYPFWFDIMIPDTKVNTIVSSFDIDLTSKGKEELKKYKIPASFPAVTRHLQDDYKFFYFSGDFADNPVSIESSYFKWIGFFKNFFYDQRNIMERGSFFWNYYKPLLTNILEDYDQDRS